MGGARSVRPVTALTRPGVRAVVREVTTPEPRNSRLARILHGRWGAKRGSAPDGSPIEAA
jgi:hypothetical protein